MKRFVVGSVLRHKDARHQREILHQSLEAWGVFRIL